jgi:predicted Rossmann fold flavoprotein
MKQSAKYIIIGGGAAGFFAACQIKALDLSASCIILEKSSKTLSKVKISGGGRCNVTHDAPYNSELLKQYPRGKSLLKKTFKKFTVKDTIKWFDEKGVKLKVEEDGRMFPVTDSSQTIIDVLRKHSIGKGITLINNAGAKSIEVIADGSFKISCSNDMTYTADKVLITVGGYPKLSQFEWLQSTGHSIEIPVPSLFTFNTPHNPLLPLKGVSVPNALVKITGADLVYQGPLLITHWGFSGPAVLKLSAWGARYLADRNYQFSIQVSWDADFSESNIRETLKTSIKDHPKKQLKSLNPFTIPNRLWLGLLQKATVDVEGLYQDLSKKAINKLLEELFRSNYEVNGKTTFKEEFVTCGGVSLDEVDANKMESLKVKGMFFAGEVLNVDGITGGFNFQAAWSTAYVAATSMTKEI